MKKLIILITLFATTLFSYCQKSDPITIKGRLIWDKTDIVDFPSTLKLIDIKNDLNVKEINVDSLGNFNALLSKGKYILKPSKTYHWQGEEIIRIDIEKSKKTLNTTKKKLKSNVILKLYTIEEPKLIPEKGILHNFKKESRKKIDSFMLAYMDYFQVPGASLAVIKNGKIVHHNVYGIKNSSTNEKVDFKTLFEAGSITKTVFAFIVMRIYEKGLINLDKPLYQYLDFKDISHDDRYKKITARLVLSHQTGFPNWARGKFELKFDPGTRFGYSGEAFEYLKRVLEKITDKSISELIKEEFIVPLGLKDIYFSSDEFSIELLANGHKNEITSSKRNIKSPMMAFSMITKADAFAQFAIALKNKKGLKQKTYNQLFKIHSTRQDGTHWGLGFRIEDSKFGRTYGHSGSTNPGFIGNYVHYDKLDMGFIVLTNSQMGGWLSLPLLTQFLITGKNK